MNNTANSVEIHIEEVKTMLKEADGNHALIYMAICYGLSKTGLPAKDLSLRLGLYFTWANMYRYVAELTNPVFSALHKGIIGRSTAKLFANFTDNDQNLHLPRVLEFNGKRKASDNFLRLKMSEHRTRRVTTQLRTAWPEKKVIDISSYPGVALPAAVTPPSAITVAAPSAEAPVKKEEENPSKTDVMRQIKDEARSSWRDSTVAIREHGVMPPGTERALFEDDIDLQIRSLMKRGDAAEVSGEKDHTSQTSVMPRIVTRFEGAPSSNGNGSKSAERVVTEKVFTPYVVGNELIVAGVIWMLCEVLKLLTKLVSAPAPRLAAAMLDPVDETRVKMLTRQIGDNVALLEDLFTVAARHRH